MQEPTRRRIRIRRHTQDGALAPVNKPIRVTKRYHPAIACAYANLTREYIIAIRLVPTDVAGESNIEEEFRFTPMFYLNQEMECVNNVLAQAVQWIYHVGVTNYHEVLHALAETIGGQYLRNPGLSTSKVFDFCMGVYEDCHKAGLE